MRAAGARRPDDAGRGVERTWRIDANSETERVSHAGDGVDHHDMFVRFGPNLGDDGFLRVRILAVVEDADSIANRSATSRGASSSLTGTSLAAVSVAVGESGLSRGP